MSTCTQAHTDTQHTHFCRPTDEHTHTHTHTRTHTRTHTHTHTHIHTRTLTQDVPNKKVELTTATNEDHARLILGLNAALLHRQKALGGKAVAPTTPLADLPWFAAQA